MIHSSRFQRTYSFRDRSLEASNVLNNYPDRKPIVCERVHNQPHLPEIDKHKYLVPNELTLGQFMYVIRRRLKLGPEEALYFIINGRFLPTASIIGQIYYEERENDGFLYIQYAKENVFG